MRDLLTGTTRLALIAGAALAVAACGGGDTTENEAANTLDANIMFEEPANDQSALESAVNATEPVPVENASNEDDATDDAVEGDGETIESNVAGM